MATERNAQPRLVTCTKCGKQMDVSKKFCTNCGAKLPELAPVAKTAFVPEPTQKITPPIKSAPAPTIKVPTSGATQTTGAPTDAPVPVTPTTATPSAKVDATAGQRSDHTVSPGDPGYEKAKAVDVQNVSIFYGKKQAVEGVSMLFQPNEITALIGPSGCGKSTLLRALDRLHDLTPGARVEGTVLLDGENVYGQGVDAALIRRKIGMVFQRPNPFPAMSIFENVVAGLRIIGETHMAVLRERAEASLRRAALWDEVKDKLDQPGTSLSGGQQQRLCIARTITTQPDVILMDEPCAALDPLATLRVEELMLELKKKYTIIIVTHNMQQAARVSDKAAFMLAGEERIGRLVEYGPTQKMFTNPSDERTEQYITGRFG